MHEFFSTVPLIVSDAKLTDTTVFVPFCTGCSTEHADLPITFGPKVEKQNSGCKILGDRENMLIQNPLLNIYDLHDLNIE